MSDINAAQGTSTAAQVPATPATGAAAPAAAPAPQKMGGSQGLTDLKTKAAQAKAAVSPEGTSSGVENPVEGVAPAAEAPPAFTPNYKFKVDEEEKEIDELFRGLMTDAEKEKKIRELHEKAFGLDLHKTRHEKLKTQFQEVSTKYTNIDKSLKQLSRFVQNDDLGSFFQAINIPEHMVFEFVKRRLTQMEAPPEQRAEIQRQENERRQLIQLQQENEELQERFSIETIQARGLELDTALASPGVTTVAAKVDAQFGKGAFRQAVIDRGIVAYQTTGNEISVHQAVQEAVAYWSKMFGQSPQAPAPAPTSAQAAPQEPQAPPPIMPNVSGRATSPIKTGPRSIADLKKLGQAMSSQ